MRYLCAICFALFAIAPLSAAPVTYVESTDGELSFDHMDPTDLGLFDIGNNTVEGSISDVGLDNEIDVYTDQADIFSFTVNSGTEVSEIFLRSFSGSSDNFFVGIDDASTFFFSPVDINNFPTNATLDANIVAYGIAGITDLSPDADLDGGSNLFGNFAGPSGGISNSLGAGTYTVYLQETTDTSDYTLNFRVSAVAVPEPSSFAAFAFVSLAVARRRARRKRTLA
ncbi:MAG: hypothetical protein AB8B91_11835 [Rubripirellula sp.]